MRKLLRYCSNYKNSLTPPYNKNYIPVFFLTAVVGISLLIIIKTLVSVNTDYKTNAQNLSNYIEPENGTLNGDVSIYSDSAASGGNYVVFGKIALPSDTPIVTQAPIISLSPTIAQSAINPLPPTPPQQYSIPVNAVRVTSVTQLKTALSGSTIDIVLADGVYANNTAFQGGAHHLWAEHLGGATLTAGLNFNSNGGEVHGLKIDISAGGAKGNDAVVFSDGNRLKVYDSWITGRTNIKYLNGIWSYGCDGVDIRRVVVRNVTNNGIILADNNVNLTPTSPSYISDADIYGVADPSPGSLDGTGESGIWVEHTVTVERVKIRHVSWMGIATEVNTNDSTFRDLDIDDIFGGGKGGSVGFYIEHWTRRSTIENFHIGPSVVLGLISEWDAPEWNGSPAGTDNIARNGTIDTTQTGAYPDEGTIHMTLQNIKFKNQSYAAIIDKGNNTVITGNDYSGIKPGAAQITHDQP